MSELPCRHDELFLRLVEAQKERESGWVQRGADRFHAHCERAHANNADTSTATGREIMRRCFTRLVDRLGSYMAETGARAHGAKDGLMALLGLLGEDHVAAVTLAGAIQLTWSRQGDPIRERALTRAVSIAEALQHDLQLNRWTKDADKTEKEAIARLKRHMEGDPRSWRRRAAALRERATAPWSHEDLAVIGMDLLKLLVEACPDVFEGRNVQHGAKTITTFRMTEAAAADLREVNTAASLTSPKYGAMIVPPRPWSYDR